MELAICTDVLHQYDYPQMLDKVQQYGIYAVEMTAGGWSSCPHINTQQLLNDKQQLKQFRHELTCRQMSIAALNCSGNPLAPTEMGKKHSDTAYQTLQLAAELEVDTIVMMSGLPAASAEDKTPNWICSTISWPEYMPQVIDYQWNQVAIPWWQQFAQYAKSLGIEKIALEAFPGQLVYNPSTLLQLRNAIGNIIGANMDPSHLIAMGADPIVAMRQLEGAIYHVHGKDTRIERQLSAIDGLLEYKPVTDTKHRTWNYVAVGCGQSLQWWKEFFSVLRMLGYNGYVALEMEDLTMSVEAGLQTSIEALNNSISR